MTGIRNRALAWRNKFHARIILRAHLRKTIATNVPRIARDIVGYGTETAYGDRPTYSTVTVDIKKIYIGIKSGI